MKQSVTLLLSFLVAATGPAEAFARFAARNAVRQAPGIKLAPVRLPQDAISFREFRPTATPASPFVKVAPSLFTAPTLKESAPLEETGVEVSETLEAIGPIREASAGEARRGGISLQALLEGWKPRAASTLAPITFAPTLSNPLQTRRSLGLNAVAGKGSGTPQFPPYQSRDRAALTAVPLVLGYFFARSHFDALWASFAELGVAALWQSFPLVSLGLLWGALILGPAVFSRAGPIPTRLLSSSMMLVGLSLLLTSQAIVLGSATIVAAWLLERALWDVGHSEGWRDPPWFIFWTGLATALAATITMAEGLLGLDVNWWFKWGSFAFALIMHAMVFARGDEPKWGRVLPAATALLLFYALSLPMISAGLQFWALLPAMAAVSLGSSWLMVRSTPRLLRTLPGQAVLIQALVAFHLGAPLWIAGVVALAGLALMLYLQDKPVTKSRNEWFAVENSKFLLKPAGFPIYAGALSAVLAGFLATEAFPSLFSFALAPLLGMALITMPLVLANIHPSFLNVLLALKRLHGRMFEAYSRYTRTWEKEGEILQDLYWVLEGAKGWQHLYVLPRYAGHFVTHWLSLLGAFLLPLANVGAFGYGVAWLLGGMPWGAPAALALFGLLQVPTVIRILAAAAFGLLSPFKSFYRTTYFLEKFLARSVERIEGANQRLWNPWARKFIQAFARSTWFGGIGALFNLLLLPVALLLIPLNAPIGLFEAYRDARSLAKNADPEGDPNRYTEPYWDLRRRH